MSQQVSKETAAEFARLFDSLIAAGDRAYADAERFQQRYRDEGDTVTAKHWRNIMIDLARTKMSNQVKRNAYADIAGPHYDLPQYLRQAD